MCVLLKELCQTITTALKIRCEQKLNPSEYIMLHILPCFCLCLSFFSFFFVTFLILCPRFRAIDDKYSRREEYRGFTQEFKEKESYKPDVKIEYVDESGRKLTPKEVCVYSYCTVC